MKTSVSFDDVLIIPKFSNITSRKDVDVSTQIGNTKLSLGVISSNMDTVTEMPMANAMASSGAVGCLHRFMDIDKNVQMFDACSLSTWGSVGLGSKELDRARALIDAGCGTLLLDVAHGASMTVVDQVRKICELSTEVDVIVGNFATAESIKDFNYHLGFKVDGYKIGIGGGSMCTTRIVTGAGLPTLASLLDMRHLGLNLIADGGIRNSGDFAKALAAGAKAVMLGKLLAGTDESPGEIIVPEGEKVQPMKHYRGSASLESYVVQGKVAEHRTPEGESTLVPYKGSVKNVLQQLEAGLRSSMTYVGATNLTEFRENTEFTLITNNGLTESKPHGKV